MANKFYITTPIFYPNANLHMGHAYTITICDIVARFNRLQGKDVHFLTGSDENTIKVVKAATEAGKTPLQFTDMVVDNFKRLFKDLDISYDQFIRTSDKEIHWPGAIMLWNKLVESGDIYKKKYKGLYCPGCEEFKKEKELVNGKCPLHNLIPEEIEEENYFFKLSKYQDFLKEKINSDELSIEPATRKKEVLSFLSEPLEDVSFSRAVKGESWGIPIPNDPSQVMYVWCDALSNYISAIGYGRDEETFKKFWPADYHVIGKDILRFHAVFWPAMLHSAGLELPKKIFVHGMITSGGRKMSKTLGNVIDPYELMNEYGAESMRYFLAREISTTEDGDMTKESFKDAYNANLANGLGNLVSRIMKMAETNLDAPVLIEEAKIYPKISYSSRFDMFDIQKAIDDVWEYIKSIDSDIQIGKPFKLVKEDKQKGKEMIEQFVKELYIVAQGLEPFMPKTSLEIKRLIKENKSPEQPLFLRKI
ncbi:MAG: methionine--tRNA ligase [Candidatus Paceibacterota bacterium]